MKFKFLFITVFSFVFFLNSFPSISINEVSVLKIPKDIIAERLNSSSDELRSLYAAKELEKDIEVEDLKYINVIKSGINYEPSAFYAADYFYLGANDAGASKYSLMRAKLNQGSTVAKNSLEFVALSPEKAYLNGIKEDDKLVKKDNPIYDKRIDQLSLQGSYPVLTSQDTTTVEGSNFTEGKRVCLVDNVTDGSSVKTNIVEINDATGTDDTAGVVGLAASPNKIFAAVKSKAGSFGDGNGGFAVLIQEDSKLKPINAVDGLTTGNKAFKLDITADQLFAIDKPADAGVTLGDIYWDANLGRLFIGLVGAKSDNSGAAGGAVSILVGRLDGEKLIIESVVTLNKDLFTDNSTNCVLGFYSSDATVLKTNCYKLRTMKTSTGKNYLIFNGSTNIVDDKNKIYAFPILGTTKNDGTSVTAADVGKIADKNNVNHDIVVQNNAGMTLGDDDAAKVGGDSLPIPDDKTVKDMFVVNDSVFACVAENRSSFTKEAGIFRSTALFDNNGNIRAWSPWQRVMGTVDKTFGAGFDINTGNYWYLTNDGTNNNTVKVTQWGKSSAKTGLMGNGLVEILADEFIQENAGVHQIFNFDEKTPSISRNNVANEMSFMAALGYKKIALIETGVVGDSFTPTNCFVKDINVFIVQDDALNNLGPICCAEVSRLQGAADGWLFVGGYNGVAILRQPNGQGWDGRVDKAKVNLATVAEWHFIEIGDFSEVRKLVASAGYLYVMTVDSISRFAMNVDKFKDVDAVVLDKKTIAPPPGYLLDMIVFYKSEQVIKLLVATTQGLFYSDAIDDTDVAKTPIWTRVTLKSGATLSNPVTHLSFIDAAKGGSTTNGNLYALSADLSLNLATIYRFNIKDGNIDAIPEVAGTDYFYAIGELRTNFLTDGALGYSMLPKHFGQTEFLRHIKMVSNQRTIRSYESAINLDLESSAHNIGVMVQNTASGGWVVPGDWGIRVNE